MAYLEVSLEIMTLKALKNTHLRSRNTHYALIIWILFLYNHFAKQKENMLMRKKVTIDFNVLSRIEDIMAERNMTERELSKRSGIPQSTINSWYRRKSTPSLQDIQSICLACDISLPVFFEQGETDIEGAEDIVICQEIDHELPEKDKKDFSRLLKTIASQLHRIHGKGCS